MRRLRYIVPVGMFAIIAFLFVRDLRQSAPGTSSVSLVDEPAPLTRLPPLEGARGFGPADLRAGHVTVLNIWASWCAPCRAEEPALARLARLKEAPLYGVVYEDRAADARQYLSEAGNPFSRIDIDPSGLSHTAWRVGGVPETFVIDGKGVVRLRYAGPVIGNALDKIILPAIARARNAG